MRSEQRKLPVSRASCAGLTLLEVILAIALISIVMLLVGMAIDFQLKATERRRAEAEQAQIVRAVLSQMSDDLRGALYAKTTDFSSVAGLPTGDIDELGAEVGGEEGAAIDESTDEVADIASSLTSSESPGLFGNRYELVVDISHLPSRQDLARIATEGEIAGPSGDVKSVAYYLGSMQQPSATTYQFGGAAYSNSETAQQRGLVRRVIDRAAARWSGDRGESNLLTDNAELIAPEVIALEFRYFDGIEWLEQWNSDDLLGLPVAVEITIAFAPVHQKNRDDDFLSQQSGNNITPWLSSDLEYSRTVVRLPTARPVDEEALTAGEEQANMTGEEGSQ
jgi:prepilin-type N-terminal cleavage/methylation domain-containing protein